VPFYRHQERDRGMGKRIQRTATTSESRIIKLIEGERFTVVRLQAALRALGKSPCGSKSVLASRLIEQDRGNQLIPMEEDSAVDQGNQPTQGSAESSVRVPLARETIADDGGDSDDEEKFR
jgi:hypothetical protein